MPVTKNYLKTLPSQTIETIKSMYLDNENIEDIIKEVELSRGIITKVLLGLGIYRQIGSGNCIHRFRVDEEVSQPYSTNEMDYGMSGKGKYNLQELTADEMRLFNDKNHKELKELN